MPLIAASPQSSVLVAHHSNVMRCTICGHAMLRTTEPVISTTTGELVHIGCADREARSTYHWRTCHAALSAGIAVVLLALAVRAEVDEPGYVVLLLILSAGHVLLNRRWWHLTIAPYWRRWR
jgi:hypothetical protein